MRKMWINLRVVAKIMKGQQKMTSRGSLKVLVSLGKMILYKYLTDTSPKKGNK